MIRKPSKNDTRQTIHNRIRKRLQGTAERPRLNIYRSVGHIYAQVIDDSKGTTVVWASSLELGEGLSALVAAALPEVIATVRRLALKPQEQA